MMQQQTKDIIHAIKQMENPQKAIQLARFFKTGKGEYGEGDLFLGLTVPQVRTLAKNYGTTQLEDLKPLLASPIHEYRLTALLIVLEKYKKEKDQFKRKAFVDFYLSNTYAINNWDLVDLTCYKLLGDWLKDKDKAILYQLAKSNNLWEQRIAIVTCMAFIRDHDLQDVYAISTLLIHHPHDLIHKAVGWLLREAGKKDKTMLDLFLVKHYKQMPRTMLRYAIEHFSSEERQDFLKGKR